MKKTLFGLLAACLLAVLAVGVKRHLEMPAGAPPVPVIADLDQLLAALAKATPAECAQYQEQLVGRGRTVLPRVKQAAAATEIDVHRQRLEAVIVRLCQPQWREGGLAEALREAEQSRRVVMVFSTVGGVNGFS